MFVPIKIHRKTMGITCDFGLCEPEGPGAQNLPACCALNVNPDNGRTNVYICKGHMVGLIEAIFDDDEFGPIARKIAKEKIAEYAEADALAEEEAIAAEETAKEAELAAKEPTVYLCSKCGKPLKNPSARRIHEIHCKGIAEAAVMDMDPVGEQTGGEGPGY